MEMKECNICRETKVIEDFSYATSAKTSRRGECKSCRNKLAKERYQAKKEGRVLSVKKPKVAKPTYKELEARLIEKSDLFRKLRLENIKLIEELKKYKDQES